MASSTPKTILVRVNGADRPIYDAQDALPANEAITPGELLAINSTEEFIPHGTADGAASPKIFAVENPYADDQTVAAINHDYATGEAVRHIIAQPGDIVYAWIAASATIVKGVTRLVSDGAGALKAETVDADTVDTGIVAVAWEDATIGGTRERKLVMIV